ncbi:MAG: biopolymer transporter ExbD [Myxococcota bacterium]
MAMSGGGSGDAMADINVTPLVDVMLVLLIIFMVTAPMMSNAGIEIDLPREEAPPLDFENEQLILSIDSDLKTYIDDQEFPREDMKAKLAAIAKANPELPVFLRAAGDVPYREVAAILAAAKDSGMPRVGLVFDPTPAPPGK